MPDPITPVAAPAAEVTPAPATPPVEPKKDNSKLLSTILGLTQPEKVEVAPVAPVEPKKVEPAAAPAPEKKVPVTKKQPAPAPVVAAPTAAEVRQIVAEENAKLKPVINAPVVTHDDSDLTAEEREELELAEFAEKRDPAKKGLAGKFRTFYQEQKKFLEKRAREEGDGYDPTSDPEFKKFTSAHEPKLPVTERKKLRDERLTSAAEERAIKATEEKFAPEITKLRKKTLELEHAPKIQERVDRYVNELADSMPEDIVTFFNANGRDVEKTREAFPGEFDEIAATVRGGTTLAREVLALRKGIKDFDVKNPAHVYLDEFVRGQADFLLKQDRSIQTRDGKQFVHPYNFKPEMARTHWTFDEEDVLGMLKHSAQAEAKTKVSARRAQVKAAVDAQTKRSSAPTGTAPAPTPVPTATPSSRTPPTPAPGAAAPAGKSGGSGLSRFLGLT